MFEAARSETGALELRWRPAGLTSAAVWILLVDPRTLDPELVAREAFLRELIRVPVDVSAGRAVVHVPVDRPIGLALVARGAGDGPTAPVELAWREALVAKPEARAGAGVFAGAADPARFQALVRTVAEQVAAPPPRAPGPTGFGVRQRRTLTRLSFEGTAGAPRVVVARPTFIAAEDLLAWREAPPADAIALPADADGIVDAATAEEAMAFYAVLEGPAPWRPLTLSPVPPPFDTVTRPFVWGDAATRLGALLASAPADGPGRELALAAARGLT